MATAIRYRVLQLQRSTHKPGLQSLELRNSGNRHNYRAGFADFVTALEHAHTCWNMTAYPRLLVWTSNVSRASSSIMKLVPRSLRRNRLSVNDQYRLSVEESTDYEYLVSTIRNSLTTLASIIRHRSPVLCHSSCSRIEPASRWLPNFRIDTILCKPLELYPS